MIIKKEKLWKTLDGVEVEYLDRDFKNFQARP